MRPLTQNAWHALRFSLRRFEVSLRVRHNTKTRLMNVRTTHRQLASDNAERHKVLLDHGQAVSDRYVEHVRMSFSAAVLGERRALNLPAADIGNKPQ